MGFRASVLRSAAKLFVHLWRGSPSRVARFVVTTIAVFFGGASPQMDIGSASSVAAPEFRLRSGCPPSFELVAGGCRFRSLYQMYSSPPGSGGLRANLPTLPDGYLPHEIDLGRYLFFDPILSGNHEISCAHCHDPKRGFSDGGNSITDRTDSKGVGAGTAPESTRRAPSLWNVGFLRNLFWDGRAHSLDDQAKGPLFAPNEMANSPTGLERDLNLDGVYPSLFREAFQLSRSARITTAMVVRALAAFEATLISLNSRYDRYAHGDEEALTDNEKHGLNIFRSTTLGCSQCHTPPLFTNDELEVTGVPNARDRPFDPGAGAVAATRDFTGAFRTPTLRNVDRKAPYMHAGQFATLSDTVQFYNDRAGHAAPSGEHLHIDWRMILVRPLLNAAEVADVVAFLRTLTDESMTPTFPSAVPSGLPVVHVKHCECDRRSGCVAE
jgi:cytochrome c peroxidase